MTSQQSVFAKIPQSPPDTIFSLAQQVAADTNPKKACLGAGAYRDANGEPWILPSVRAAEAIIGADFKRYNKEYPPMAGFPEFLKVAQEFLLGEDHEAIKQNHVASCQAISGTGALHLGFCVLQEYFPGSQVYIPAQTWINHYAIYQKVYGNVAHKNYTYLSEKEFKIDFDGTLKDMREAPNGSTFLLHACAHNPSGVDFSKQQWHAILDLFREKHHIAFFDVAYQGFASGSFEDDGYAPRLFAKSGMEFLVAQSFSKNFGLYGERVGACHFIHNGGADESSALQSAMCQVVRSTWSLSPVHGAYIVMVVGNDHELKQQFLKDVQIMSNRIKDMRTKLYDALLKNSCPGNWEHIVKSIGMFSYTGLSNAQVQYMREKHSVYLIPQRGRMCMCGLTDKNVGHVAEAMKDAVENCE